MHMHLRIASYNVHKCLGLDRRRRPERVAEVLSALGADILALQEVDHRLGDRPAALSRSLAEEATGLTALPAALGPKSCGWHGQTLLVRPALTLLRLTRLELPGLEPRGALLADLDSGAAGLLRIVAVHLALMSRYRRMQLAAIGAALSHLPPMPTAIIGDFNEWSPRRGAEALGPGFRLHSPGPSFPAARPMGRLDRIALGPGLHLVAAGTHAATPAAVASDHLPIWADLTLGAQT